MRIKQQMQVRLLRSEGIFESQINDPFEEEPVHHRWLLTTCIAGFSATLVLGIVLLGIFEQNALTRPAFASVTKSEMFAVPSGKSARMPVPVQANISGITVIPGRGLAGDNNYPAITSDELPYGAASTSPIVLDAEISGHSSRGDNVTWVSKAVPPEPIDETFTLAAGGSLVQELVGRGVSEMIAQSLTAALREKFSLESLASGIEIEVTMDRQHDFYGREVIFPVELSFKSTPDQTVSVVSDEDGRFIANIENTNKVRIDNVAQFHAKEKVGAGLYATARDNKIPDYIVSELIRVFSYDVDFQRQVQAKDVFEVFYGNPLTGSSSKRKVLHYAELRLDKKTMRLFRYTDLEGRTDYYDEMGRSSARALLKTPVSATHMTSGFGVRRHPILGYSKMHAGVDFGVAYGAPIRAAGNGTISLAGRNGAYGTAVVIQHNSKYETLYAHMSKLADGIRSGIEVNQGQVIGYVGSSGRSTGPHLHYEVRVDDRPVNPLLIRAAGGRQLSGEDFARFKQSTGKILAMMQSAPSAAQLASAH